MPPRRRRRKSRGFSVRQFLVERAARRKKLMKVLWMRYRGRCAFCETALEKANPEHPLYATIDHIRPLSKGGADELFNMQLACKACNSAKGNLDGLP